MRNARRLILYFLCPLVAAGCGTKAVPPPKGDWYKGPTEPMRDVVLWEREVAAREVEVADRLRNVNALRASLEVEGEAHLGRLEAMVEVREAATQAEISRSTD